MTGQLTPKQKLRALRIIKQSELLTSIGKQMRSAEQLAETIILNGTVNKFAAGEVLLRKGEYGSHLHFPLEGTLLVLMEEPAPDDDDDEAKPSGLLGGLRRRLGLAGSRQGRAKRKAAARRMDVEQVHAKCRPLRLESGSVVGEVAVLTRSPYGRTIVAEAAMTALTLNWQGLRDLLSFSQSFRQKIWKQCGRFAVNSMLPQQPFYERLSAEAIAEIEDATTFERLGAPSGQTDLIREGDLIESLYIVQSGIGRIFMNVADRKKSIGYIGYGDCYGLSALALAAAEARSGIAYNTLQAEGEMSLLSIPAYLVERHILPILSEDEIRGIDASGPGAASHYGTAAGGDERTTALLDFFVGHAFTNGRQAMLIDQERCVGCDECVKACARTHGGTPRFARAGPAANGYAVVNACMHCAEPLCLIDCPTGAISRQSTGEVVVSDPLCIGCGTCVRACPYDNIQLVEMSKKSAEGEPMFKAHKCDLCIDRSGGPACVAACPHDALARIDLTSRKVIPLLAEKGKIPLREVRARQIANP